MIGLGIALLASKDDYSSPKASVCSDSFNSWNQNGPWMDAVNSQSSRDRVNLNWETGNFGKWKQAAYALAPVPVAKDIGVSESVYRVPILESPGKVLKTELDVNTSFRNLGPYLSMIEAKMQKISNFYKTNEVKASRNLLMGEGYHSVSLYHVGIENLPRRVIAREDFTDKGNSITFSKNYADIMATGAKIYGVTIENKDEYSLNHGSLFHPFLAHLPPIASEKEVERLIQKIYEKLAEKEFDGYMPEHPGSEANQKERYRALAEIAGIRAKGITKTYFWDKLGRDEKGNEGLEGRLIEQYTAEAIEKGCKTEEEIKEYVSERLSRESGKEGKEEREKRSGLEEKVEEESSKTGGRESEDKEYSGRASQEERTEANPEECEAAEECEAEAA